MTPESCSAAPPCFDLGVFVCGVYRSASTWSYNVVREGARRQKLSLSQPVKPVDLGSEPKDVALLKLHHTEPEDLAMLQGLVRRRKVIITLRPAVDCIGSMMKTFSFDFENAFFFVKKSFEFATGLADKGLVLPYEEVSKHPLKSCFRVLAHVYGTGAALRHVLPVYMSTRRRKLAKLASRIQADSPQTEHIGSSYFDKETLLHRHHVSLTDADYASAFTSEQRARIASEIDSLASY